MFETLFACAAIIFAVVSVVFVAKLFLTVVLLPIHFGLFLIKGLLILLCVVPVIVVSVIASIGVVSLVPLVALMIPLMIFGLPVLLLIGGIVLLIKLLT